MWGFWGFVLIRMFVEDGDEVMSCYVVDCFVYTTWNFNRSENGQCIHVEMSVCSSRYLATSMIRLYMDHDVRTPYTYSCLRVWVTA